MPGAVALLRAVNVGSAQVAMSDLRAVAAEAGLAEARTLLQTGNLIFRDPGRPPAEAEALIGKALADRLGLATTVMVRTGPEWAEAIARNPFPDAARDQPAKLVVLALKAEPADGGIGALRAAIKGPEEVALAGRQLYAFYPDGIGRSKLTLPLIEKKLGTEATGRNWNTALKIAAMLEV